MCVCVRVDVSECDCARKRGREREEESKREVNDFMILLNVQLQSTMCVSDFFFVFFKG